MLAPDGIVVMVGSTSKGPWIGPLARPLSALLLSPFASQEFEMLLAELNPADLETLRQLLGSGQVRSVIDRRYALAKVPAAIAYLEEGRARGKVVVNVFAEQEEPPAP